MVQNGDTIPESFQIKVIHARHDFSLVMSLINGYPRKLLNLNSQDEKTGIFTVMGTPEALQQLEEQVAKYDVAPKNIELLFYLVEGSNGADTAEELNGVAPGVVQMRLSGCGCCVSKYRV